MVARRIKHATHGPTRPWVCALLTNHIHQLPVAHQCHTIISVEIQLLAARVAATEAWRHQPCVAEHIGAAARDTACQR